MVAFCSERKEEAGPPVKDFLSPLSPPAFPLCLSLVDRPTLLSPFPSPFLFPLFPFRSHSSSFLRSPSSHPSFCRGFTSPINHQKNILGHPEGTCMVIHLSPFCLGSDSRNQPAESCYRKTRCPVARSSVTTDMQL